MNLRALHIVGFSSLNVADAIGTGCSLSYFRINGRAQLQVSK